MTEVALPCEEGSPLADGAWLVQPMLDSVHVVFEPEARLHEYDRGCWCHPAEEMRDPVTQLAYAKPLVIHRHGMQGAA